MLTFNSLTVVLLTGHRTECNYFTMHWVYAYDLRNGFEIMTPKRVKIRSDNLFAISLERRLYGEDRRKTRHFIKTFALQSTLKSLKAFFFTGRIKRTRFWAYEESIDATTSLRACSYTLKWRYCSIRIKISFSFANLNKTWLRGFLELNPNSKWRMEIKY